MIGLEVDVYLSCSQGGLSGQEVRRRLVVIKVLRGMSLQFLMITETPEEICRNVPGNGTSDLHVLFLQSTGNFNVPVIVSIVLVQSTLLVLVHNVKAHVWSLRQDGEQFGPELVQIDRR